MRARGLADRSGEGSADMRERASHAQAQAVSEGELTMIAVLWGGLNLEQEARNRCDGYHKEEEG